MTVRQIIAQVLEVSGLVSLVIGGFQITSYVGFGAAGAASLLLARGLTR